MQYTSLSLNQGVIPTETTFTLEWAKYPYLAINATIGNTEEVIKELLSQHGKEIQEEAKESPERRIYKYISHSNETKHCVEGACPETIVKSIDSETIADFTIPHEIDEIYNWFVKNEEGTFIENVKQRDIVRSEKTNPGGNGSENEINYGILGLETEEDSKQEQV